MIYFDNNATAKPNDDIKKLITNDWEANPSSSHKLGISSRLSLELARENIASFIGARHDELIFTSSATEANNLVIQGVIAYFKFVLGKKNISIIFSQVEHHSILNLIYNPFFYDINFKFLPVGNNGIVDVNKLESMIDENVVLVSVMMANNETGIIMPFYEIGEICKQKSILYHCDAVCATSKIKYLVSNFNCDFLTISSHKMYGPYGLGCLYIKQKNLIKPMIYGGHQENDLRAGTENVNAIINFSKICNYLKLEFENINRHYLNLKNKFISIIKDNFSDDEVTINFNNIPTLSNTVSLTFNFQDEHEANAFAFSLDLNNLMVSRSSACASLIAKPSHVLKAIGFDDLRALSTFRISFGISNIEAEVIEAVNIMRKSYNNITHQRNRSRCI